MKCPAWISKEAEDVESAKNILLETLQDDGLIPEHHKHLLDGRQYEEVCMDDIDEASQRTLELMESGVETIYGGVLTHGRWVARPDLLEKVEGTSAFGNWYYVACDMKRSSRLKDEYMYQGAFYAETLQRVQGVRPVKGYVLHVDGHVSDYLIRDIRTEFHLVLDEIEAVLDGQKPEHFLTSGYKQSPYFYEFLQEVQACDHLSLLNRVWRSEVSALEAANIKTVTALANAHLDDLRAVRGVTMERLNFLQQQAISMKDNTVIAVGEVELPEEPGIALVIDIESDPLRDVDYLFGVLIVDGEKEEYKAFLAESTEDEERNWHAFAAFLEKYHHAHIYHYGWYEYDVFMKLAERYGAPDKVRRMFEEQMIDVLTRLRNTIIFPMPFYSLKDLAKYLGFAWRIKDASGPDSVLWYEQWLRHGDKKALQQTIDYNEDDVRATWLVRTWAMQFTNTYGES